MPRRLRYETDDDLDNDTDNEEEQPVNSVGNVCNVLNTSVGTVTTTSTSVSADDVTSTRVSAFTFGNTASSSSLYTAPQPWSYLGPPKSIAALKPTLPPTTSVSQPAGQPLPFPPLPTPSACQAPLAPVTTTTTITTTTVTPTTSNYSAKTTNTATTTSTITTTSRDNSVLPYLMFRTPEKVPPVPPVTTVLPATTNHTTQNKKPKSVRTYGWRLVNWHLVLSGLVHGLALVSVLTTSTIGMATIWQQHPFLQWQPQTVNVDQYPTSEQCHLLSQRL